MQENVVHRSLKEKQRQERTDLILQAAEEVLMDKGYHDTSMDEIASRVGIAKGTLYLHFPSKEDLVFALFSRELEVFLDVVKRLAASSLTPTEKLKAIFNEMFGGQLGKRMQLLISLYSSVFDRKGLLEKKAQVHKIMEELTSIVTAIIEDGKDQGVFDQTIPTQVMISTFFNLLSPHIYKRLVIDGQLTADELVTYLERFYFKGITQTPDHSFAD